MNFFKKHPKYEYRHKILEYLYTKIQNQPLETTELKGSISKFTDVANYLGINPEKLKEYHYGLHSMEKDHVKCDGQDGEYKIGITEAGVFAYTDSYWLREGERERNERIDERAKWILPIISLVLSVVAFIVSLSKSCD